MVKTKDKNFAIYLHEVGTLEWYNRGTEVIKEPTTFFPIC